MGEAPDKYPDVQNKTKQLLLLQEFEGPEYKCRRNLQVNRTLCNHNNNGDQNARKLHD